MASGGPSILMEIPLLEKSFLAACQENDFDRLVQLNAHLSQLGHHLEHDSFSNNPICEDKATGLYVFSHNVYVASSSAAKVQLDMEEISTRFTQQLSLITLPSPQGLARAKSCTSIPNSVLKQWSLRHMSCLFPSKEELEALALQTSTCQNQINLWFRNARTRSGWSKLFAHPRVNKDHERLKTLLAEYESIKRHNNLEQFKSSLARDELLQLLDKVFLWFATSKQGKPSQSDSVKPWVKEVLNNALATLKNTTAGAIDSSRQFLPSLPSRKRARTKKNTPSPSLLSQSSSPIAGASSIPTLESPRSSLSHSTTTGSFFNPDSTPNFDFSPILGYPSSDSLYSGDPSPSPASTSFCNPLQEPRVLSSVQVACTPVHSITSLSPVLETTPCKTDPVRNPLVHSNLPISHPATVPTTPGPNHTPDLDQFEDAEED